MALFNIEEFTSLLARGKWEGSTILEFLTEVFDCPPVWELKYRHNKVSINLPTLSIATGTTSEWFWKNARADDFFGGFGNRFLYLTGTKKVPIPNPSEPAGHDLQVVREAIRRLASITPTVVRFSWEAEKLWARFYVEWERQDRGGLYGAAVKRIHVYVRKLALVYAALEGTIPEITVDQLKAAIAVGLYSSECARALVDLQRASIGRAVGEMEGKFLDWLRRNDGSTKRYMQQTLSKFCGNCELFNKTLTNLMRADHIEVQEGKVYLKR